MNGVLAGVLLIEHADLPLHADPHQSEVPV